MMQSHMAARKHTTQARSAAATRTAKPAAPTLAPVLDLGRAASAAAPTSVEGEYRFNQQTGRLEKVASATASPFIGDPTLCLGVTDEYNPLYPNDYEVSGRTGLARSTMTCKVEARERHNDGNMSLFRARTFAQSTVSLIKGEKNERNNEE